MCLLMSGKLKKKKKKSKIYHLKLIDMTYSKVCHTSKLTKSKDKYVICFLGNLLYFRALEKSDTYVVLINFGAREERIDISKLTKNLTEEWELAVTGSDSCYKQR